MGKNIAVIPARSGSKGLPHKNIKPLCGLPLIAHTIQCATRSRIFDEIHVSTDSEEYAGIARQYGAAVPFLRSPELAGDTSGSWDVVRDVLAQYEKLGQAFDTVTLLQPTSPLRIAEDILDAMGLFDHNGANAVVSVCEAEHSPLWCGTLPDNLSLDGFIPDSILNLPRQSLPPYYRINGAVYIVRTSYLSGRVNLYSENCYAYIMPVSRSLDIDSEWDFLMAQAYLEK